MQQLSPLTSRRAAFVALIAALAAPAVADTVTGRVVNPAGVGIGGVTLEFSNGVVPLNPVTALDGSFTLIVPGRVYDEIIFLPSTNAYAPLVLRAVTIAGITNLGTITLPLGFQISGVVVNEANAPIPGVDLDIVDETTRQELLTPGDSTTATGAFSVTVPAGSYAVQFKATQLSGLVSRELRHVSVAASLILGTIRLENGVPVSGTVTNRATGLPLQNIDIDVDDAFRGVPVFTHRDNTDSLGRFSVIVPTGLLHLSFEPPAGVAFQARQVFNIGVRGARNIGTVPLDAGVALSGRVVGPGGVPVTGVDIDVLTPRGDAVLTTGDVSNQNGDFTVIVANNSSYILTADPIPALGLAGAETGVVSVSGATTAPTFQLVQGAPLAGTITDPNGGGEFDAAIRVFDLNTGRQLIVPGDKTDATGAFTAYVPPGTWRVMIESADGSISQPLEVGSLPIPGPTTLNRQLTAAPITIELSTFGLPSVAFGAILPLHSLTIRSRSSSNLPAAIAISAFDVTGVEYPLLPPLQLLFPVGFQATSAVSFWPIPLLPVPFRGEVFRYKIRLEDPVTRAVLDRDSVEFIAL